MKSLLNSLILLAACFATAQTYAQMTPQAQCSQDDWTYMVTNQEEIISTSTSCYIGCLFSQDLEECVNSCLLKSYPELADSCIACASMQVNCVVDNCSGPCIFPNSQNCQECVAEFCADDFLVCVGDDDADGFTIEGGDCNNQDSLINPLEIEIPGDGIDQNCDGLDILVSLYELADQNPLEIKAMGNNLLYLVVPTQKATLQIYDINGRLLKEEEYCFGEHYLRNELNQFGTGLFILKLFNEEAYISRKILINP